MITIPKDKIKECILETQCLLACDDEDVVTDIFTFAWKACAAHYEAELLKRDAIIAEKEAPLREMVEMMDSGDEHGAGSPWHKCAKQALSLTHDSVRLVDVGEIELIKTRRSPQINWCANTPITNGHKLYTIVKGE